MVYIVVCLSLFSKKPFRFLLPMINTLPLHSKHLACDRYENYVFLTKDNSQGEGCHMLSRYRGHYPKWKSVCFPFLPLPFFPAPAERSGKSSAEEPGPGSADEAQAFAGG